MSTYLRRAALTVCFALNVSVASAQTPSPSPIHPFVPPPASVMPAPMPTPIPIPIEPDAIPAPVPFEAIPAPFDESGLDLDELYHRAVGLYDSGQYDEAIPLATDYVATVKDKAGDDTLAYASAISLLARIYQMQGSYAEAEPLVQRALVIHEREHGPKHPDVASDLDALAQLYQSQNRLNEAEPLFRRSLAIYEEAGNEDPANLGRALNNLAWLMQEQGRYADAVPLVTRALSVIEKAPGPKHPDYGRALDTLAKLYEGQGRPADAEPLYRRAAAILDASLGPDHISTAASQENLGGLLKATGNLAEAETLLKNVLATKERVFGPDHPSVANSLAQLGDLYRIEGRTEDAEPLFRRALAIRKTTIREVPVFFATDRKPEKDAKVVSFGGERAGALTYGQATVMVAKPQTVPTRAQFNAARPGAMPATTAAGNETTEVARLAIRSISLVPDERPLMQGAEKRLDSARVFPKQIFVFVHGFNVSFENALRRTAQIAYDLNFDGAPFLFSWPSRGGLLSYTSDRESAEIAVNHLKKFLDQILEQTHATKVHLIAHSMGNVVLLNALEKIKLSAGSQSRLRFAEIILHSPDVDKDRFNQLMAAIDGLGANVTLYASTSDRALGLSGWIWGVVGRAGAVPAVVPGVETIDITAAGSSLLGLNHDLYATNPAIFDDMRLVLELGKHPPDKRSMAFEPTTTDDGVYWLYRRIEHAPR